MGFGMRFDPGLASEIKFADDSLQSLPRHSALIAQIVSGFSLIEGVIGGIYGALRHKEIDEALDELDNLSTNHRRVQACRKEIAANPLLASNPAHDWLMLRVLDYAERRNKVAHGLWGVGTSNSRNAYWLPSKRWASYLAAQLKYGIEGTYLEEAEKIRKMTEVYTLEDLSSLKAEGDGLLEEVFKLYSSLGVANAVADGWDVIPETGGVRAPRNGG